MDAQPGSLFACGWEAEDPHEADGVRIVEIASASEEVLRGWVYGEVFASPPTSVAADDLRRIALHPHLDGPIAVDRADFRSWQPAPVERRASGNPRT